MQKIQFTIVNTIPLWKSQMVLALGVIHSSQAAKAKKEVTDMTNELLRKKAEIELNRIEVKLKSKLLEIRG